jgi:hypothetical protein
LHPEHRAGEHGGDLALYFDRFAVRHGEGWWAGWCESCAWCV